MELNLNQELLEGEEFEDLWNCPYCSASTSFEFENCSSCQIQRPPDLTRDSHSNNNNSAKIEKDQPSLKVTGNEWYDAILNESQGDIISWMTAGGVDADVPFDLSNDDLEAQKICPLHLAMYLNKPDIAELLLNGGCSADVVSEQLYFKHKSHGYAHLEEIRCHSVHGLHLALLFENWRFIKLLTNTGVKTAKHLCGAVSVRRKGPDPGYEGKALAPAELFWLVDPQDTVFSEMESLFQTTDPESHQLFCRSRQEYGSRKEK